MASENSRNKKVTRLLYSLTGITIADDKDMMISNRLLKLKRDSTFEGDIDDLLDAVENGKYTKDFINSFTTNKTHFFREGFHFEYLRDNILPHFAAENKEIKMFCSASSTGEEPYSMAMTVLETQKRLNKRIKYSIVAADIDTTVLQYAANGIYRYAKSSKEFPSWIKPQHYFKKRVKNSFASDEIQIKVNKELQEFVTFQQNNLNDETYPFPKNYFDVLFCRNVLIYFTKEDQDKILRKLFRYLKINGTLYIGHSESPHSLINYVEKVGQNIFKKIKEIS